MQAQDIGKRFAALGLLALLLLAGAARLWLLDRPSLWEDDYLNLDRGLLPLSVMWDFQKWQGPADTPYDFQPPLYFALLHGALNVSQTSLAAKGLGVAAGLAGVLGMFALGARLFGRGAGLLAALVLAASLMHLEASRAIKAYGLFFAASLWSAWCAHKAANRGGAWWAAWVASALATLYAAYIGLPAVAGQALWIAAFLIGGLARGDEERVKRLPGFLAACLVLGLAYLPWVPAVAFLQDMFRDPGADPLARLTWPFAKQTLASFFTGVFPAPDWFVPALLAACALGLIAALAGGRGWELALALLWAGLPTATVLASRSVMNEIVSARHLFNLLAALCLLPGLGIWAAVRLTLAGGGRESDGGLGLSPRREKGLGWPFLVAMVVCLGLLWPALKSTPQALERSISLDRDFFYWLWANARPGEALMTEGWKRKSKAFGASFSLPGQFAPLGDFSAGGMRSVLLVENQASREPGILPDGAQVLAEDRFGPFRTRVSRLAVVSRAPLLLGPDASGRAVHEDDFATPRMLAEAFQASNAAPDLTLGALGPVRASQPAQALYAYVLDEALAGGQAVLELSAVLYKKNRGTPSDSILEVLAGSTPEGLTPVGTIAWKDFLGPDGFPALGRCLGYEEQPMYQTCVRAVTRFPLALGRGGRLFVALRFTPGRKEGYLLLDAMHLEAHGAVGLAAAADAGIGPAAGAGASSAVSPDGWDRTFLREVRLMLANAGALPWSPGATAPGRPFAFAALEDLADAAGMQTQTPAGGDGAPLPLGSPAQLAAFRAEHPGVVPVHALKDPAGREAVLFFDPPARLTSEARQRKALAWPGGAARGLVLRGRLEAPSLGLGGHRLDIPVVAPSGSVLMLNPGGQGRLVWSPDFSRRGFGDLDFFARENIRPAPDADNDGGLTCDGTGPCSFQVRFVSALPVTRLRLEWYPRVVADPSGRNAARLSLSTDEGKTFRPLETFTGDASGDWTPMFRKHARELTFDQPVHHLILKAELSGEDAQIWSHSRAVDRMWLEASLDARSLAAPDLSPGDFDLTLAEPAGPGGNAFEFLLLPRPLPFFDTLKDWR